MEIKPLKTTFIIVDRRKGNTFINLLNENGFNMHTTGLGRGTAPSDFAAKLNLGEREKEIISVVADVDRTDVLLNLLRENLQPGDGIAFTIPISSISNMEALQFLMGVN